MFQARHMNEIARVIRNRRKAEGTHDQNVMAALEDLQADVANMLERTNPAFNRERFNIACNPKDKSGEARRPLARHRAPPKVNWPEPVTE